jgi:hypothetical protein
LSVRYDEEGDVGDNELKKMVKMRVVLTWLYFEAAELFRDDAILENVFEEAGEQEIEAPPRTDQKTCIRAP